MGKRVISTDDWTGADIDGELSSVVITVTIVPPADQPDAKAEEISGEFELAGFTVESVRTLVGKGDLAGFILRMRPLVKLATPDSEVVRKWLKANHPEIEIADRGRIPAEGMSAYRNEVVLKTQAGDAK
jgi:hypothetical protein